MESYSYLHLGLFLPARRPPEQTNKQKTHAALEGFTWDIELSAKSRPMHPVVSPSSPQFDLASAYMLRRRSARRASRARIAPMHGASRSLAHALVTHLRLAAWQYADGEPSHSVIHPSLRVRSHLSSTQHQTAAAPNYCLTSINYWTPIWWVMRDLSLFFWWWLMALLKWKAMLIETH
jgi:hypothetical protein